MEHVTEGEKSLRMRAADRHGRLRKKGGGGVGGTMGEGGTGGRGVRG